MFIALLVIGAAGLIDHFLLGDVLANTVIGTVGEFVAEALGLMINGIISIFGTIFFWVANTTIDWAMKLNSLLAESPVVQEGFSITLSIANLGLVVGFIVMAIAIMIRAEWMVETRKSIPKFITAALLINFGFFILVDLMIKPVDGIFKNIYDAAHINMDTFRGTLSPNLDIKGVAQVQMRIAKIPAANEAFANKTLLYSTLVEERLGPGVEALLKHYETGAYIPYEGARLYMPSYTPGANHFSCVPAIGYESVVVDASGTIQTVPVFVTEAQRQSVTERITHTFTWFLEDMNDDPYDNSREEFMYDGWGSGNENIDQYFDDFGAPYKSCAGAIDDLRALQLGIANFLNYELAQSYNPQLAATPSLVDDGSWGMGCQVWDESSGTAVYGDGEPNNCICGENNDYSRDCVSNIAWNLLEDLNNLENMMLLLLETLFHFIFTLLGAFTLLGVGLMLIYRYVALSFLIILFPFVWLGWIFPKIATMGGSKNIWTAWWGQFLRWLLFGPIAMFFIYLSAKAAIGISTLTTSPGEAFVGKGSMAVLAASVGNAAVVIGLLIGGTYVAQKMGIAGSGMIMGTIKSSGKWLTKQTKGAVGRGAARAGNAVANTKAGKSVLSGLRSVPVLRAGAKKVDAAQEKAQKEMVARAKQKLPEDVEKLAEYSKSVKKGSPEYLALAQKLDEKGKLDKLDGVHDWLGEKGGKDRAAGFGQKKFYEDSQEKMLINPEIRKAKRESEEAEIRFGQREKEINKELEEIESRPAHTLPEIVERGKARATKKNELATAETERSTAERTYTEKVGDFIKEKNIQRVYPSVLKEWKERKEGGGINDAGETQESHDSHKNAVTAAFIDVGRVGALRGAVPKLSSSEVDKITSAFRTSIAKLGSDIRSSFKGLAEKTDLTGTTTHVTQIINEYLDKNPSVRGTAKETELRERLADLNNRHRAMSALDMSVHMGWGGSSYTGGPATPPPSSPPPSSGTT